MSDTSGRINFGTVKKKIRFEVRKHRINEPPESKPTAVLSGDTAGSSREVRVDEPAMVSKMALPKVLVWVPLRNDGSFEKAFIDSELVAYLSRMAGFVEGAATFGIDRVIKELGVESDSIFSRLQRKMREEVNLKHASEFNGVAGRAFQVGTTIWAGKLLRLSDPTKFKVNKVVEAVRRDINYALILSAKLILQEYGERILRGALPGGETDKQVVKNAIAGYRQQFEQFMSEHSDAAEWGSRTIASTVKKYVRFLLK